MNRIIEILQTIAPVMIVLLIGVILRQKKIIDRDGINTLKTVAVNIVLTAVLLSAFATTSYSLREILIPVIMSVVCIRH